MPIPCRAQSRPRDLTRRILLTFCLVGSASRVLAGCHPAPSPVWSEPPRHDVTVYLISDDWHTEIALPCNAMTGPSWTLTRDFPNFRFLRFGWGERGYFMARQPGAGEALRALFPGPAVLLVTPLDQPPASSGGTRVFAIGLSTAVVSRLADYVWAAFARSADDMPCRLAAGPEPGSVFYAATGTYSAAYTCNTWTAEALQVSGIPVHTAGVVFAHQVTSQVQALFGVPR